MPSCVEACAALNGKTAPKTAINMLQPDLNESVFMVFLLRIIPSLDLKHLFPALCKPPGSLRG
jgi:hypothetical protein